MKYFDSHAHYYDERFESECSEGVDNLIGALLENQVSGIINVGTSPETSRLAINQAKRYRNMFTAIGIHPSDSQYLKNSIEKELLEIEELIKNPESKCVCLGEIGLDYHYPDTDKERQMLYFEEQMRLAEHLDIPVSIHDREAHADVLDVIKKHPNVRGVLHSYSGSAEMALELICLGYMISFSGTLTFTNARKPKEVAAAIQADKILIETDCPYLAPHPNRGKLNHSGYLEYTTRTLASLIGLTEQETAELTESNARRFFGLNEKSNVHSL
jgi:TatD DNase family protein